MATLDTLKRALRQRAKETPSFTKQPLSDEQYSAGFDILTRGSEQTTYRNFIIPQLSQLLAPLLNSRIHVSVLEIGPGPKTVLGYLPSDMRRKVSRYVAFEPNNSFATELKEWLRRLPGKECVLPSLESSPVIHPTPFTLDEADIGEHFDIILFCHSMYGMKPKTTVIERALELLVETPGDGQLVVFHRSPELRLDGLVCYQTASFPAGCVSVSNDDETLDHFARFVAGVSPQNMDSDIVIRSEWREICRALGRCEISRPDHLLFSTPDIMMAFNRHATTLPELTAQVPLLIEDKVVKNREARLHRPAAIVAPTEVRHIQQCVRWALEHTFGLTILGGSHSGHCIWPNVVAVDMSAFDNVHVVQQSEDQAEFTTNSSTSPLVVAEAGCKTEHIISKAMSVGLTVPLGSRPSVGAGMWLQGGMGHLSRMHGLACDAVVGAIIVSVGSGEVFCVGHVPDQHRPADAIRPKDDDDILWAIKGAGTNVGIIVSVTFKTYEAPVYLTRNWIIPLSDSREAKYRLRAFDNLVARRLSRNCSAGAYLYSDNGVLHLGVTMFESTTQPESYVPASIQGAFMGKNPDVKTVDGIGLFDSEMYVSEMHGGHCGGKTSSFKRCLFLKDIRGSTVVGILAAAIATRPSPLCYLHLLQGGGAISDIAANATAFGCRDWKYACVITGVWPRDKDGTAIARAAEQWVYNIANHLLPCSTGVYGADLGPDRRDAILAAEAFGPNRPRLARLKQRLDPQNVLAYACPLPKAPMEPKLIILVTGDSYVGKDYCADAWASMIADTHSDLTVSKASISDATKRDYAAATGADLGLLCYERTYKEQHRLELTSFFQGQVQRRPQLPEEHFLDVVYSAADVDVLLITGMRDEAPLATFSHLVPDSRVLEVGVRRSKGPLWVHQGCQDGYAVGDSGQDHIPRINGKSNPTALDYCPSFIFQNDMEGNKAARDFAARYLFPFLHEDLKRLANMVRTVPNFPRQSIDFRHVLGISQQPGGLALCTSLLQSHFDGNWSKIDAIACCEAGSFVFASALAKRVSVRLALIREAGKLPPPTVSVQKSTSHVSSSTTPNDTATKIELERDSFPHGASVVVVDDVLATGETLCTVLQLLGQLKIRAEDISVMVVAEFPIHRGRELLRQRGFGRVSIQSLLVFGGA